MREKVTLLRSILGVNLVTAFESFVGDAGTRKAESERDSGIALGRKIYLNLENYRGI